MGIQTIKLPIRNGFQFEIRLVYLEAARNGAIGVPNGLMYLQAIRSGSLEVDPNPWTGLRRF